MAVQLAPMKDELAKDAPGTLRALKAMGYDGVELPPDFKLEEASEMARLLREADMHCAGFWVNNEDAKVAGGPTYAAAHALRPYYLAGCVWCGDLARDWRSCLERLRWTATAVTNAGHLFVYHGHGWDWGPVPPDGKNALDMLFDELPADIVQCMFDTFYVTRGGVDAAAYLRRYAGRMPALHMKELKYEDGGPKYAMPGDGVVDWPGVIAAARDGGVRWLTFDIDPKLFPGLDNARKYLEFFKDRNLLG